MGIMHMRMMRVCGLILVLLYATLMIFSIFKARLKGIPALFIAVGSLLILSYTIFVFSQKSSSTAILIIGMMCISAGTFFNGVRQNNLHIHHHIIRLIIEAVITWICI